MKVLVSRGVSYGTRLAWDGELVRRILVTRLGAGYVSKLGQNPSFILIGWDSPGRDTPGKTRMFGEVRSLKKDLILQSKPTRDST